MEHYYLNDLNRKITNFRIMYNISYRWVASHYFLQIKKKPVEIISAAKFRSIHVGVVFFSKQALRFVWGQSEPILYSLSNGGGLYKIKVSFSLITHSILKRLSLHIESSIAQSYGIYPENFVKIYCIVQLHSSSF